jgi:hypothetical protein
VWRGSPERCGQQNRRWTSQIVASCGARLGNFEPDYDADSPVLQDQPVDEKGLTEAFTREAEDFIPSQRTAVLPLSHRRGVPLQAGRHAAFRPDCITVDRRRDARKLEASGGYSRACVARIWKNARNRFLSDNGGPRAVDFEQSTFAR